MLETDDTDIYFRIYKNGSIVFSAAQSTWDDPLDGTGASGVTLLDTAFQAIWGQFLYLGGTEAKFGFIFGGKKMVTAHSFYNVNVNAATFVNSPSQPITYSIHRTSGTGAVSTAQICSRVGSLGRNTQRKKIREHLYEPSGVYTFQPASIGTEYAWFGVKLNTRGALANIKAVELTSTLADDFIVRIRHHPTLSAGLTYGAVSDAPYDMAYAPTPAAPTITVSGGHVIFAKVLSAVANQDIPFTIDNLLLSLGQNIDGTFEEFVVSLEPITANLSIRGAISIETEN